MEVSISPTFRRFLLFFCFSLPLFVACKHDRPQVLNPWVGESIDSVAFKQKYHYWHNYNFIATDTIRLAHTPTNAFGLSEDTNELRLHQWDAVVVTNITSVPSDTTDSMWVMLARDPQTMGWVRAKDLHDKVVPDNFISRFIYLFSSWRMLLVLSFLALGIVFFGIQNLRHARSKWCTSMILRVSIPPYYA